MVASLGSKNFCQIRMLCCRNVVHVGNGCEKSIVFIFFAIGATAALFAAALDSPRVFASYLIRFLHTLPWMVSGKTRTFFGFYRFFVMWTISSPLLCSVRICFAFSILFT
jgi:hypothetical protein